ncbi:Protein of unknown function (DUF2803) [Idiomarina sp. A28L]|uniref:DUF2803 domain-containing protein n=1 Tax=Idiomarina sp. A28L TaxID=1036674 RepID=UPI0002138634|nr:DUF2803 domain-containing protein [Idiomarina sp. A28L]EGN75606.1 Protein of unknown function (DUF2803) [Idiomarina sp. A28L]
MKFSTRCGFFAMVAIFASMSNQAFAEEITDRGYRWFEIEVMVFRYTEVSDADPEQFPRQVIPFNAAASRDLLSERIRLDLRGYVNALPTCSGSKSWVPILRKNMLTPQVLIAEYESYSSSSFFCRRLPHLPLVASWYQGQTEIYSDMPHAMPVIMSGRKKGTRQELLKAETPFTVHIDNFRFQRLRRAFEQRSDTEVLLHTAWRQPVFNQNVGRKIRLFGGKNFSNEFDYAGFPVESSARDQVMQTLHLARTAQEEGKEDVFSSIDYVFNAIDSQKFQFVDYRNAEQDLPVRPMQQPAGTPKDVWQFDGLLDIYLIGNYLHIDTDFSLREVTLLNPTVRTPEEQIQDFIAESDDSLEFLRAYPLKQLRRVISHETHYFDHPNYAVVIEIRRTELSGRR